MARSRVRSAIEPLEERRLMALPQQPDPTDPGGGPGPIYDDNYEPNNSFATATPFGVGPGQFNGDLTLTGSTAATRDVDYFRIDAPQSGAMNFTMAFYARSGSPTMTLYNSAQTQVGSAVSGTTRSVTIPVTAGQTYYVKIGGATIESYSLEATQLSASWDWSMPGRFGGAGQNDQYGLPVINNTEAYAQPITTSLGGKTISRFPVKLQAATAAGGASYYWTINGTASDANGAAYSTIGLGAAPTVDLPNGQYDIKLAVTAGGQTLESTQHIVVRNYLLVAVGDSYSSGEGNPHANQTYNWADFRDQYAQWAKGGDDIQTLWNRMAHRSSKAAVAQAALAIENADPKTSVTFVFLSQSGATINAGLLNGKPSAEKDAAGNLPGQLDQLHEIVGQRHIDALTMSIGGNDIGFGDIFAGIVDADAYYDPITYLDDIEDTFTQAEERLTHLSGWYGDLNNALKSFDVGQIFLTEYPDLTKDGHGEYKDILYDIGVGFEADAGELKKAVDRLLVPFVTKMHVAAATFGWDWVGGISDKFANNGVGGYGTVLRTAKDSIRNQGPLDQGWQGASPNVVKETKGMMHPIGIGLDIQRDAILDAWRRPDLIVENFSVGSDALLFNPKNGYAFTIRNASFLTAAPASLAGIWASPDANVTNSDYKLFEQNTKALAPGESVSYSGVFNPTTDPFRVGNALYLSPLADAYNAVYSEANDYNNAAPPAKLTSDRDVNVVGSYALLNSPRITVGQTAVGAIGYDEIIGNYDIDSYRFTVQPGQRVRFNVDSYDDLDTYLKLYKVENDSYTFDPWNYSPIVYASNDNGAAPGESPSLQSFLEYTFTVGGEYAIQISHKNNADATQMYFSNRQYGSIGHYTIATSLVAADSTPPTVASSGYDLNTHRAWFRFSEDVNPSMAASVLKLTDRTHGNALIANAATGMTYDAVTKTAWFKLKSGLADADYRAALPAGTFADLQGNASTIEGSADLFVLAGDMNHDRTVGFEDLVTFSQNYGKSGLTFSQGNVDYSADGKVTFDDLVLLSQQYGKTLGAAPKPSLQIVTTPTAVKTPTNTATPIKTTPTKTSKAKKARLMR